MKKSKYLILKGRYKLKLLLKHFLMRIQSFTNIKKKILKLFLRIAIRLKK